jgi:hypothetical protein
MTKEPKTGDRMFELMKEDKKLMEEKYNIIVAGWCADTSLCSHITMWVRKSTWDIAMFAAILGPGIRDVCTYSRGT